MQQLIHRAIKTSLGCFQIPGFELFLSDPIIFLGARNQISDGVGLDLVPLGLDWLCFRYGLRKGGQDRGQRWSVGLGRRQACLALVAVAGRARGG